MQKKQRLALLLFLSVFSVFSCKNDTPVAPQKKAQVVVVPPEALAFNSDSAYVAVQKQLDFGIRLPNTEGHRKCAAWLVKEFKRYGLTVIEQPFEAKHYLGTNFKCNNIIAQYKPELQKRVLIGAHWDSRFQADQDTKDKNKPILGADDGASGVAVMLEMARVLKEHPVDIGVDFICFDAEDQGNDSEDDTKDYSKTWCLGAQYWAQHPHQQGYFPLFGILLDMVGGSPAKFPKEGVSMQVAPTIVNKVWAIAGALGYSNVFVPEQGAGITDDHYFVITQAKIPMIDIINRPGGTPSGFISHWHTHADDMSAIDKNTLRMVGQTCLGTILNVNAGTF